MVRRGLGVCYQGLSHFSGIRIPLEGLFKQILWPLLPEFPNSVDLPRAGCAFAQAGDLCQRVLDRTGRCLGIWEHLLGQRFSRDLRVSGERQVSEVHKEKMFNHPQRQREQGSPGKYG